MTSDQFTAYATIDAAHFMLKHLNGEMKKAGNGLVLAIDKATGYDKIRDYNFAMQARAIFSDMIEAKEVLQMDCKTEKEILEKIESQLV